MESPSAWKPRIRIACIALVAALIALYLSLYQWKVLSSVWDPVFGSGTADVLDSPLSHEFARWIHIPDAMLGVFAYLFDVVFALIGSTQRWKERPWLVFLFGTAVIPVGLVSITLVALQGLVVKHWCFLCLVTAAISLILIFLAYDEVITTLRYLREIKKRSHWHGVWQSFLGHIDEEVAEITLQKREGG